MGKMVEGAQALDVEDNVLLILMKGNKPVP